MINFYQATAAHYIEIDENEGHLFCTIPSEKDMSIRYRLECTETNAGVEVLSCSCPSRKPCKHIEIVRSFWSKIYKSNIEKAEAKQEQVAEVPEVGIEEVRQWAQETRKFDSCIEKALQDQSAEVEMEAAILGIPVSEAEKIVDISTKGSLKGNKGFSVLKTA